MTRAKHNPANCHRQRGHEILLGIDDEQELFFVTRAKQNNEKRPPTTRTRRWLGSALKMPENSGASVDWQTM